MYFVYLPGLQLAGLISIELLYESYKIDLCRYGAGNDTAVNDRIFNSESNYSMTYGSSVVPFLNSRDTSLFER